MDADEDLSLIDRTADVILLSREAIANGLADRFTNPERLRKWSYEFDPSGLELLRRAIEHAASTRRAEAVPVEVSTAAPGRGRRRSLSKWGQNLRPAGSVPCDPGEATTYTTRSLDDLPPLSDLPLDGTFGWLPNPEMALDWAIGGSPGQTQFDPKSVDWLERVADATGISLPQPLIGFLRSEKRNWFRSVTGCWLELPTRLVNVPGKDAVAIRFLNDQQGVQFWYATVAPSGEEQGVVASDDLFDAPEPWLEGGIAETYVCAPSFEAFMFRFWIENEIWFRTQDHQPLTRHPAPVRRTDGIAPLTALA